MKRYGWAGSGAQAKHFLPEAGGPELCDVPAGYPAESTGIRHAAGRPHAGESDFEPGQGRGAETAPAGLRKQLDSMVEEADNTVYHMAQLAKFCKESTPAETRVEAVKTQASQPTPDAEDLETSTAAVIQFRDQGSVAANPWLSSNGE